MFVVFMKLNLYEKKKSKLLQIRIKSRNNEIIEYKEPNEYVKVIKIQSAEFTN